MTYATSNPPALVSQRVGADGGAVWIYKDGDSLTTIGGINYFTNAKELGMKAGDKLIVSNSSDGTVTDCAIVAHRTSGTASGATTDTAGYAIGASVITLASAGTGTLLVGDVVTIGSDPTEYELTDGDTDVSGGGNMTVSPVLVEAITAAATAIKVVSGVLNVSVGNEATRVKAPPATYDIMASESGTTFYYNALASQALTLPVGVPGLKYRFINTVLNTSNSHTLLTNTTTAGDFFVGGILGAVEAAATGEMHFANGTTHLSITQNRTTQGGLIGGNFTVECIAANLWLVDGVLNCTATPITPFAA